MTMDVPSKRAMRFSGRKSQTKAASRRGRFATRSVTTGTLVRRTHGNTAQAAAAPAPSSADVLMDLDTPGLSAALRTVIEDLPANEIISFIEAVTGNDASDGLDPTLWGPSPSTAEATRAHMVNLAARFADRQAVLTQSITRAAAAQLLGISDQAVSDRLAAGDLVGLKDGRAWKLPAWQFDADTESGWLPGIAQLRQHFPTGPVTLTAWATTPNVDLGDHTPAAVLAAGDLDQVLLVAQARGPAAW